MHRSRNLHKSRNCNHPRVAIMECIDMVKSLRFSLNNMRTALRCIESNFFINFCGILIKSELQYISLFTIIGPTKFNQIPLLCQVEVNPGKYYYIYILLLLKYVFILLTI